jgi:hypothetical protein
MAYRFLDTFATFLAGLALIAGAFLLIGGTP